MYLLRFDENGILRVLDEKDLFKLWLHFYDLMARSVIEVVDDTEEEEGDSA